jgi:hypothetical protein
VQLDEEVGVIMKPAMKTVPISPIPSMEEEHNEVRRLVFGNWCRPCTMDHTAIDPHCKVPDFFTEAVDELYLDLIYIYG